MRLEYSNLVNNYLIVHMFESGFSKYGIVDASNGKEYVKAVFDGIKFHKDVNLIELRSGEYRALWKLSDFEQYAKSL